MNTYTSPSDSHAPLPMRTYHITSLHIIAARANALAEELATNPQRDHYITRHNLLVMLDTLHLILYNEDTYGHHNNLK